MEPIAAREEESPVPVATGTTTSFDFHQGASRLGGVTATGFSSVTGALRDLRFPPEIDKHQVDGSTRLLAIQHVQISLVVPCPFCGTLVAAQIFEVEASTTRPSRV